MPSLQVDALFGERVSGIYRYVDILTSRGIDWGLLGPRERDRIWDRHIFNSVAITGLIGRSATVADVGSGAGLPGIPLAILRPDLRLTLIEPLLRRSTFLAEVVDELGLAEQVTVSRARAEDLSADAASRFEAVTSRAVAPLGRLAAWCAPLVGPGGRIVAIKGRSASEELGRDAAALRRLGMFGHVEECRAFDEAEPTFAVVLSRGADRGA